MIELKKMKGGKEEEKIVGPLFPRLHVNDADKGGPRAPPRNKMALYEQLSIPSQRFSSAPVPAPSRPLPPQNGGLQVPSTSLSQVDLFMVFFLSLFNCIFCCWF